MKIVSVINYKGGVGKTTITANLAAEMARQGKRVLAIDLDPQTNLTFSFIPVDEWSQKYRDKTIQNWFNAIIEGANPIPSLKDLIVPVKGIGIDLICSHLGLIDVDIELARSYAPHSLGQHERHFVKTYSYIKNELEKLREDYDVVLFDCPPNFGTVTRNALIASDYYVVPAKMDALSTLGINQLRGRVQKLVSQYNEYVDTEEQRVNPQFLGVIATMISLWDGAPIQAQRTYINQLQNDGVSIFSAKLRENKTIYASAPEYGIPVVLQSAYGPTYVQVIVELRNLTTEFMEKVGV